MKIASTSLLQAGISFVFNRFTDQVIWLCYAGRPQQKLCRRKSSFCAICPSGMSEREANKRALDQVGNKVFHSKAVGRKAIEQQRTNTSDDNDVSKVSGI